MKVNVEKRLHETAQELEKLAWLCSNSATHPSLIELDGALRCAASLMRLAQVGLAVRADRIKKLEELCLKEGKSKNTRESGSVILTNNRPGPIFPAPLAPSP